MPTSAVITVDGVSYDPDATYGPGTYTVVATIPGGNDGEECTDTEEVTITQPENVVLTVSHTNVSCNGLADGTITASAVPTSAVITVDGVTYDPDATYGPGTYTVVATIPGGNDGEECTDTEEVTITQPENVVLTVSHTNVSCNGLADGTITASAVPTSAVITVDGVTYDPDATYGPGTYTVVATIPGGNDGEECTDTEEVTITQPENVVLTVSHTNVSCNGLADGTITASAVPTSAVITVDGVTYDPDATYGPGTYTVVATIPGGNDGEECTDTEEVTITQPENVVLTVSHTNVSCNGLADGTITASAVPTSAVITVDGVTYDPDATYGPGTYTVVATIPGGNDGEECTDTEEVTITQPENVVLTVSHTNVSCNGLADGTITASAVPTSAVITVDGVTYDPDAAYGPGTYTVVATIPGGNDGEECTDTEEVTITQPENVVLTVSHTNVSCNGLADGTITASAVPTSAVITVDGVTYDPDATYGPGTYTVVATIPGGNDGEECTDTEEVTITQPENVVLTVSHTNVSCNGLADGTITASAVPTSAVITVDGVTYDPDATYGPGTYTVVATIPGGNDGEECTDTEEVTITQPENVVLTVSHTNVSCNGLADGTITASAVPTSAVITVDGVTYDPDATYGPGTYTVVATIPGGNDGEECTDTEEVTITQPENVVLTVSHTNVSCNGLADGTITASAVPTSAVITVDGVTYDPDATYGPGTYTVVATIPGGNDGEECTDTEEVTITQPENVVLTVSHTNVSCNGLADGTITASAVPTSAVITVDGVTYDPDATYGPGTYTVVATIPGGNDGEECTDTEEVTITQPENVVLTVSHTNVSCNGLADGTITASAVPTSAVITVDGVTYDPDATYGPGTYTVVATIPGGNDGEECTDTEEVTITQPENVVLTVSHTNVSCNGLADGTITASAVPTSAVITVDGVTYDPDATYGPGTYTVVATIPGGNDGEECTDTEEVTITQPENVVLTVSHTNVSCNGLADGTITASAVPTSAVITVDGVTYDPDATYGPGTYTVVATIPGGNDGEECTDTEEVTITQPEELIAEISYEPIECFGGTTTVEIIVNGGTPGYIYTFNGVTNSIGVFENIGAGVDYSWSVVDANDCSINGTVTITEPGEIFVNAGEDGEICETDSYQLQGSAENYESALWTGGTGTFSDATDLNAVYTPGIGETGAVTLTLTAYGIGNCPDAEDSMTLIIHGAPTAYAGEDATVCEDEMYDLDDATATNYETVRWYTSGDGHFNNATVLNTKYTPGESDIAHGFVTLTLYAYGSELCEDASDEMTLFIEVTPEADAGPNATICETDTYYLEFASASNYESLLWTTTGDGTFNDETALNPVYTPGSSDITSGSVVLILTAYGNELCGDVSDEMTLSLIESPIVFAGEDATVCDTELYELNDATADNYTSLLWTTSGDGEFSNTTILNPVYAPGSGDLITGTVTLTLSANGIGSCGDDSDEMTLTFNSTPQVFAGEDANICANEPYTLSDATATNYSSLLWTTNGDGTFDNETLLNPIYTPGVADISAGSVVLFITAYSGTSCPDVTDEMTLSITLQPDVFAGEDAITCGTGGFELTDATADMYESLLWTTSGDGAFDNANILHPVYVPGVNDISEGSVMLTLTAFGSGSCGEASDDMMLEIVPEPTVFAGIDAETCASDAIVELIGSSATNYVSLKWTTSGDGSFDDNTILNPIYTAGANDIAGRQVTLTLTAYAAGNCEDASASLVLMINDSPVANAGNDQTIQIGTSTTSLDQLREARVYLLTIGLLKNY